MRSSFLLSCLIVSGCSVATRECRLPPLAEVEIASIASEYLIRNGTDPDFRKDHQVQIVEFDCRYRFEVARNFNSYGPIFYVTIDRGGRVVGSGAAH